MSTPTTTPTTTTTTTDLVESVGLFLEWCYYLFLPIVLVVGTFCFAKTVIKATKFYEGKERLDGKTIVITGGSNGLGRALAVELCRRGARVISACRTRLRRDSTAVYLREKTGSFNHRVMYMDLNNLESVRNFARELVDTEERVDCLINNAGIICDRDFTADGIDRMMGINYVGHFLLTNLLCEKIMTTPNGLGKVISITGGSFNRGSLDDLRDLEAKKKTSYDLRAVYRSSKLGLYVMNRELARRFTHFDICSLCVDPGLMSTDFYRNLPAPQNQLWSLIAKCMFRSPEEGMQSVLHALLAQDIKECSGMVIKDCEVYTPTGCNWTDAVIEDLWTQTLELLRNKGFEVELGVSEEVDLGTVSSGVDAAQLDLQRLARLAKRSVTDDEEEGPQLPPRPATPPRSNKTHLDEGNEMVETVEFHAEEPAEVVRTTPSRQGSVEKDKTKDKTVVRQKSDVEVLREILQEEGEASGGLLRVNANVPREPTPTLESLADETTPDINTLKKMLDEEETADLRKIEEMLRAEGTSVDDVLSAEDYDLEGQDERDDILKVEKMLRDKRSSALPRKKTN